MIIAIFLFRFLCYVASGSGVPKVFRIGQSERHADVLFIANGNTLTQSVFDNVAVIFYMHLYEWNK